MTKVILHASKNPRDASALQKTVEDFSAFVKPNDNFLVEKSILSPFYPIIASVAVKQLWLGQCLH